MRRNEVPPGYGEWLRYYRECAGFTQRQLAGEAAVSYVTVNHLENDRRLASDRVARLLATELRKRLRQLQRKNKLPEVLDDDAKLALLNVTADDLFPHDGRFTPTEVLGRYLKRLKKQEKAGA